MESDSNKLRKVEIKSLFRDDEWADLPEKWKDIYLQNKTINQLYNDVEDWSWLALIGLIHDNGKLMSLEGYGKLPQWSVVGDTYPVGCPFDGANVLY